MLPVNQSKSATEMFFRYNKLLIFVRKNLLIFVRKNLIDLDRGIQGLVLISEDLEKVMFSLFENKVPDKWKFAYSSLKPLSLWMADLNKRVEQLRSWVAKGSPASSGFPGSLSRPASPPP